MHGLVLAVLFACSTSAPEPDAPPPRKTAAMAKSSKATPSASRREVDALLVGDWENSVDKDCDGCGSCQATAVKASSTRASAARESFDAAHLLDGNPSSAWCEGEGEGEPSSVTFTIPSGCRVHGLEVSGGHLGDRLRLNDNGRPAKVSLAARRLRGEAELPDPVALGLNLRRLVEEPAVVHVGWAAHAIDELRVTFDRAHPGARADGVCVSELRPVLSGTPTED